MYGKAACPVPRGAGDSTGIWKRYCGTIAKAGGNGENKLLPAVTEGSCLLEKDNKGVRFTLATVTGPSVNLLEGLIEWIVGADHADFSVREAGPILFFRVFVWSTHT